eukprot:gnl/TRDRNA2_/TRDRNA2_176209_c5_seq18.p1 gnl/TRDRNA2_/TRDRNA2_176209_c5~~gnl/TRDRNA2_/TRDRNA2_176209_c5_seq18.p1  ORF type:complete len:318 (+),score=79.33 gnl/TRDRNA2_/TRDRNA2_176209_c5_seq18:106-954(+)
MAAAAKLAAKEKAMPVKPKPKSANDNGRPFPSHTGEEIVGSNAKTVSMLSTPFKNDAPERLLDHVHSATSRMHRLQDSWCLWFRLPNNKSEEIWQDVLTNVHTFSTVEKFWQLIHNIKSPSSLGAADLSYFKEGVKPAWEDATVKNGGRWIANVGRISDKDFDELWLTLVCKVIGETFIPVGSQCLCGIVVSTRQKKGTSKIAVWISEREETRAMAIGQAFRCLLQEFGFKGALYFDDFKDGTKSACTIPTVANDADVTYPASRKVSRGPPWLAHCGRGRRL